MDINPDVLFIWRLINLVAAATCLMLLSRRYFLFGRTYNKKTLDYWYAMVMWCMVGLVASLYGLVTDAQPLPVLILVTAAEVVSLKGLLSRTEWGGQS